jgi:hypothetical protein
MGDAARNKQRQQELTYAQRDMLGLYKLWRQGDVAFHAIPNGTMHYV